MGILDSFKKLFSGEDQADSKLEKTQPQPPPRGAEGNPSAQADPPAGRDANARSDGTEEEEFVDLFDKDDDDQEFVDLFDDTQH